MALAVGAWAGCVEGDPPVMVGGLGVVDETNRGSSYVCPDGEDAVCSPVGQEQSICRNGRLLRYPCSVRVVQPVDGPWSVTGKFGWTFDMQWEGPFSESAGQVLQTYRRKIWVNGNVISDQTNLGENWEYTVDSTDDLNYVPTPVQSVRFEVWLYKKKQLGFYQKQEIREFQFQVNEDLWGYYPGDWGGGVFVPPGTPGPAIPGLPDEQATAEEWDSWWDWLRSLFTPSEEAIENYEAAVNDWQAAGFVGAINALGRIYDNPSAPGDDEGLFRLETYDFEGVDIPTGLSDDMVISAGSTSFPGWAQGSSGIFPGGLHSPTTFGHWRALFRRWSGWAVWFAWGLVLVAWLKGKLVSTI